MRGAFALALLLALAACAGREGRAPVSGVAAWLGASPGTELLGYLGHLRAMNEAALAAEAARMRSLAQHDRDDLVRVKAAAALALAQPGEDGEVVALVEPVARREGADADLRSMASFLHAMVLDRRRLRESAAAAGARVRDERRLAEAQKQRADALQERAAALQQKLDAFTEIEKSLSDRQVPPR